MAIIAQEKLFGWEDVEKLGDLERLKLVLSSLPDEALMKNLEAMRGKGRDDYPVRPTWNSVVAGIVFGHESVASLRRELKRNAQLRQVSGFDPLEGAQSVPTDRAYSHLLKNLLSCEAELRAMFDELVDGLEKELPDFGENLAVDSKAIDSHGRPSKKGENDGRRDTDADWGTKTSRGKNKDGSLWEKVTRWFGYKVHLLVDASYELPVAFEVTRASVNDTTMLMPLVKETKKRHKELVERAQTLAADRGYDSKKNCAGLYDDYGIKPLIDIRDCWDEEGIESEGSTRVLFEDRADQMVYDFRGTVYCQCPVTDERREMAYMGFESDRQTLKYRCPAAAYGLECKGRSICGGGKLGEFGRVIRIPIEKDRRVFTPLARSSYAWKTGYKKRTAVERVNSRLAVSFGFERHYIRGLKKMNFRVCLALLVMNAMALGRIRVGQKDAMRSLVGGYT
jgi:Transposase DDE domain